MLRLSLSEALSQLKNNRLKFIERLRISSLCKEFGLKGRKRLLTPQITIELFFLQILDGNTAINGIIRFSKKVFTASAYCQARSKLPVELFKTLLGPDDKESICHEDLVRSKITTGRWLDIFNVRYRRADGAFWSTLGTERGLRFSNGPLSCHHARWERTYSRTPSWQIIY